MAKKKKWKKRLGKALMAGAALAGGLALARKRATDAPGDAMAAAKQALTTDAAYGVWSEDPAAMDKIKIFFEHFQSLPTWFTNLWILVVASVFGIKGTQIFRNGKK